MTTIGVAPERPTARSSHLSRNILIGLTAGVATGLVVGERAAVLQVLADAYLKLLQMTVLPYLTVSLVGGLGGLDRDEAIRLGTRVSLVLLLLWTVALAAVFTFPLLFPHGDSASFFSTTLLEERAPLDLVGLYIPANPFNSLANNVVPAVVLFSALLGVALIAMPGKAAVLHILAVANGAIGRVAKGVVSLTPYGLFAIAAVTAGTFDPHQAAQLEVYLVSYIALSLLLAFWVLPALVAALTPVPYRAVLSRSRDALLVAFSTGSLFVVLPLLTEDARELLREHTDAAGADDRLPEVIVPASFNFPHTAKLLSLSFVLFAGWFAGSPVPPSQFPALAATGVLVLFGNLSVAIPYLLDLFRIPADTFQLFLATSVVNSRFGTLLSAVHTLTIALIGSSVVVGLVRFQPRKLARFGLATLAIAAVTLGATRALASRLVDHDYDQAKVLTSMHTLRDRGTARVFTESPPPLPAFTGSVLDRVRTRRTLRVGYFGNSLPFAFTNEHGELVGFDIEMALQLARDLGVSLELVPADRHVLETALDPAACDVIMSGTVMTADRALHVMFTTSYLDETLALVMLDHRRGEFATWDDIQAAGPLRLGVPRAAYYLDKVRQKAPAAVIVPLDSPEQMFARHDLDALVLTAERGSAYTLLHPEYSVVVPRPGLVKVPLAYVVAGRDQPLRTVIDTWLDLKRKDGTIDELFAHWILGRDPTTHRRRWSVLDDVMGWRGRG